MNRVSRHMMFMQMAEAAARRSTCYRRSVGAILVSDSNNVLSIGYNGPPSGKPHCTGANCPSNSGCIRAVHAEANAIQCVVNWSPWPKKLYVTESPCEHCAKLILGKVTISEVYYINEYRIRAGIDQLVKASVGVFRMTPGGYLIDYKTDELVEE